MDEKNLPVGLNTGFVGKFRKSFTCKIIMIGLVVLLCQIPIAMVDGLISRRQTLAQNVEADIV